MFASILAPPIIFPTTAPAALPFAQSVAAVVLIVPPLSCAHPVHRTTFCQEEIVCPHARLDKFPRTKYAFKVVTQMVPCMRLRPKVVA